MRCQPSSESSSPRGPYRTPGPPGAGGRAERGETDIELTLAAMVVLVASVVRVAPALSGNEAFGAEPTLALFTMLFCGWVVLGAAVERARRRGQRG